MLIYSIRDFLVSIFSLLVGFKTDLTFTLKLYFWLYLESLKKWSHEKNNKDNPY